MENDLVIKAENLGKKFTRSLKRSLAYGSLDVFRSFAGYPTDTTKLRKGEFWAIEGLNFHAKRGDKIGFIGENGSGKSTLLRVISGILPPDQGRVEVAGRVGSLIAVGAGFHPHMTGKENIYLNGTILGMSRRQIKQRVDDIIEFAEIGEFIDAPINTYSSGMRARLGFSVAVHVQPDIMLIDEVLSVGDLSFALKARKKLGEYRESGGTFILVSHNMQMIRNTCDYVYWLEDGRIVQHGSVYEVCNAYEDEMLRRSKESGQLADARELILDNSIRLLDVKMPEEVRLGETLAIEVEIESTRKVEKPIFSISIENPEGMVLGENYSYNEQLDLQDLQGRARIKFTVPVVRFRPGVYAVSFTFSEREHINKLLWLEKYRTFNVLNNQNIEINQGLIYLEPDWQFELT